MREWIAVGQRLELGLVVQHRLEPHARLAAHRGEDQVDARHDWWVDGASEGARPVSDRRGGRAAAGDEAVIGGGVLRRGGLPLLLRLLRRGVAAAERGVAARLQLAGQEREDDQEQGDGAREQRAPGGTRGGHGANLRAHDESHLRSGELLANSQDPCRCSCHDPTYQEDRSRPLGRARARLRGLRAREPGRRRLGARRQHERGTPARRLRLRRRPRPRPLPRRPARSLADAAKQLGVSEDKLLAALRTLRDDKRGKLDDLRDAFVKSLASELGISEAKVESAFDKRGDERKGKRNLRRDGHRGDIRNAFADQLAKRARRRRRQGPRRARRGAQDRGGRRPTSAPSPRSSASPRPSCAPRCRTCGRAPGDPVRRPAGPRGAAAAPRREAQRARQGPRCQPGQAAAALKERARRPQGPARQGDRRVRGRSRQGARRLQGQGR